jgi:hypothetical protein
MPQFLGQVVQQLLRRTFTIDVKCERCHGPLRLIALIKTETIIKRILGAMHLPTQPPQLAAQVHRWRRAVRRRLAQPAVNPGEGVMG